MKLIEYRYSDKLTTQEKKKILFGCVEYTKNIVERRTRTKINAAACVIARRCVDENENMMNLDTLNFDCIRNAHFL